MSGKMPSAHVAAKRAAVRDHVVTTAWAMVRAAGFGALSLRDLGDRVGLRAQSLYSYFPSKDAILDAMFRQGYAAFISETAVVDEAEPTDWRATALAGSLAFFDFCTADPVRYQLLFTRPVPGFEPSAESMAVAIRAYELTVGRLERHGITGQAGMDMWTAVITGLVSQQIANDLGGTRWRDLVPVAVDMLLARYVNGQETPR